MLSKDEIRARAKNRKTETISVPEWDGDVTIQELSAGDRDHFEQVFASKDVTSHVRGLIVAKALIDPETKQRLYSDAEASEISEYGGAGVQRIFEAIVSLSGMKAEKDKALEEAAKN
jgi:hypothetical protein